MKKILASVLAAVCMLTVSVAAIETADEPITGGNTVFTQEEFMFEGESIAASNWSNAFCNEDWTGCRWTAVTEDGIDCIKVVPVGNEGFYMDFNYYQWNNDKYYPSLDCNEYRYLKVKFKMNDAGAGDLSSTFWASTDSYELGATRSTGTTDFTMSAPANEWTTVIIDCSKVTFSDGAAWENETIRQFRYYPFGAGAPAADAACYIEYMAWFGSEAEAKAYDGPVVEVVEAETTAAAEDVVVAAPQTFDMGIVAVVTAIVSAAGYAVSKKR